MAEWLSEHHAICIGITEPYGHQDDVGVLRKLRPLAQHGTLNTPEEATLRRLRNLASPSDTFITYQLVRTLQTLRR